MVSGSNRLLTNDLFGYQLQFFIASLLLPAPTDWRGRNHFIESTNGILPARTISVGRKFQNPSFKLNLKSFHALQLFSKEG
jgi:predicted metal-dependent hydrolase